MSRTGSYSARVALPESLIPEQPRSELRAGVTGSDFEVDGVTVRAGCVPLVRRADGRRCLRLAISSTTERGTARVAVHAEGAVVESATLDVRAGLQQAHLFVPPAAVELEVELGSVRRRVAVAVEPQRHWRIFLVHHSHLDVGYTDPQAHVVRNHLAYLDSALDYAQADDAFRWTIESNLVLERWLATRPPASRDLMLDLLRAGRFEACALPFTLHAHATSIDELARQLRFAHELRALHGVEVVSAMQTDVPGAPPGLPLVLADAGVRFLSVAHNWAGRATPYLTGGETLPRAFRWRTRGGKSVVVWHTDSPHGVAYLEGNVLGLADSLELVEELLPDYLASLAARGYPYIGALGVPVARAPYGLDVLHLRVQGAIADNAAPSPLPAQIARAWNERYASPELRVATSREFFHELPHDELETFTGDWADWWADGLGSSARAIGFNRRAQCAVRTGQTLAALAGASVDADETYERIALFDEHTWGAAHPRGDAESGRESGVLQWQTKAALATDALASAEALVDAAVPSFHSAARPASVLVVNPSGFARTDVVSVQLPETRRVAVVDAETQERVQHAFGPPEPSRNTPRGQPLSFVAANVPALGYRRFDLLADDAEPLSSDGSLENEHYRLELDVEGGCAISLLDKQLGLELVDPTNAFGLGQVVHDRYGSALDATRRLPTRNAEVTGTAGGDGSVFLLSREVGRDGAVVERVSNGVEERVTIRLLGAGCERIETTFRLARGVRRLDVSHRLAKTATTAKESLFVVFPFALRSPSVAYELTGGVGGRDAVPGSAAHMHAIRHWVELADANASIAWATLEAPLVQLGDLFLPYPPYPGTVDGETGGLVASWAMNNVWDTNFPSAQGGEARLSYAVASAPPGSSRSLAIETAASLTQPLVAVLGATREPSAASVCEIDAPGIEVALVAPAERGFVVHLQSYAEEPVDVGVAGTRVTVAPGDYVTVPVELA